MKLKTVIGTAIAAVGLVACGSTVSPTLAPTVSPTVPATTASTATPTPTAPPTAVPTPTPIPCAGTLDTAARVAEVCNPVLTVAACDAFNVGGNGGSVSWTGTFANDELIIALDGSDIDAGDIKPTGTSGTYGGASFPPEVLAAGDYGYLFLNPDEEDIAHGNFTIVACPLPPELGWTTTCAVAGTAQGGSLIITFTGVWPGASGTYPDYITVDGNAVDVTGNPFTSGPYTVGDHDFTTPGHDSVNENGDPFTIAACPPA